MTLTQPAEGATVQGPSFVTVTATATDPADRAISYGFDAAGFRRSRTLDGTTTRYLLGGLLETTAAGTITSYDTDGPAGDLAHYPGNPSSSTPTYLYYSGHGDLAVEDTSGARSASKYDPFGQRLTAPSGSDLLERFTGRWDKKLDPSTGLVEMGARPYDPTLGRFLAADPVDGGSLNAYEYAGQDPTNAYDLSGEALPAFGGVYLLIDADDPDPQHPRILYVGSATDQDVDKRARQSIRARAAEAKRRFGVDRLTYKVVYKVHVTRETYDTAKKTIYFWERQVYDQIRPPLNRVSPPGRAKTGGLRSIPPRR